MIILIKIVLTIAGSDCSGGAGIQADIKTITVHKMYAMSVITALTAQNTLGVSDILETTPEFVAAQMDSVFTDIFPDAVKIGMVSNPDIIAVLADKLKKYGAKNIVIDPVMVSTSGSKLMSDKAVDILKSTLFPMGTVITPNIPEAEVLSGIEIKDERDMLNAAEKISDKLGNVSVLIKGGHMENSADDLIYDNGNILWLREKKIENSNTHGTGCTLSSAIACGLANGMSVRESIAKAKRYITGAIRCDFNLGKGSGPLEHTYII